MADFEVSKAVWSKSIQGLDSMATDISASIKSVNRIRSDLTVTLIDIGKGAGVAPVITDGADYVCKKITGKTITEGISDLFWDSKAGQAIIEGAENVTNAAASWFNGRSSMLKQEFAF